MILSVFGDLAHTALGLGFGLALAGYLLRRSVWDGLFLSAPVAAGDSVELWVGALLIASASAIVFALTRRPRFAAAAGAGLLAALWLGIRSKERFAGTPLTLQDLEFFFRQFGDNVGVMASQPTLLAWAAVLLVVMGGVGWCFWRLDRAAVSGARPAGHVLAGVVGLVVAGWTVTLVHAEVDSLGRDTAWTLGSLSNYGHPLSAFLATAGRSPRWMPPDAPTGEFSRRVRQRMAVSVATQPPADIVLFLQESQFNTETIDGCPADLCRLDVFQPSVDVLSQGPLQVHIFGGGTWLSEFALESGVPHSAFGPSGDFAPFTVAPGIQRSFARSLKAAGYRTVALYPVPGGMMNARTAYASYGFDRFLDSNDLGLSGSYATTDEQMHAAARRVLAEERKHGGAVFLMVVTIFNHAEHGARMDRVPPGLVDKGRTSFGQESVAANVADYVWRTREFARSLAATRPVVLDASRPAVLAWFGDHQPPFGNALEVRDRIRPVPTPAGSVPARMQTWFQLSGNVRNLDRDAGLRALDIVFLPGLLAQAAGVRFDEWLAANSIAREDCGGLLETCGRPASRAGYLSYLRNDLQAFGAP